MLNKGFILIILSGNLASDNLLFYIKMSIEPWQYLQIIVFIFTILLKIIFILFYFFLLYR